MYSVAVFLFFGSECFPGSSEGLGWREVLQEVTSLDTVSLTSGGIAAKIPSVVAVLSIKIFGDGESEKCL